MGTLVSLERPMYPRGEVWEQMVASLGRVECQLTMNDSLSEGPTRYKLVPLKFKIKLVPNCRKEVTMLLIYRSTKCPKIVFWHWSSSFDSSGASAAAGGGGGGGAAGPSWLGRRWSRPGEVSAVFTMTELISKGETRSPPPSEVSPPRNANGKWSVFISSFFSKCFTVKFNHSPVQFSILPKDTLACAMGATGIELLNPLVVDNPLYPLSCSWPL